MRNLDPRRRWQQDKKGSECPSALSPGALQVQAPHGSTISSTLEHLLHFIIGPENCWFLALPHCLLGLCYSSLSRGYQGGLLLSRSFAASDGLLQVFLLLMILQVFPLLIFPSSHTVV